MPLSREPPQMNIYIKLILWETRVIGLHLRHIQIFLVSSKRHVLCSVVHNGCSMSSTVIDFGTKRKCVCNFLLLINSNLVILVLYCPVSEIVQIFCWEQRPYPFPPVFWGVPLGCSLGLDYRCWSSEEQRPKLINHVITFKVTQLLWP